MIWDPDDTDVSSSSTSALHGAERQALKIQSDRFVEFSDTDILELSKKLPRQMYHGYHGYQSGCSMGWWSFRSRSFW
jgi:hypothetical protein